MRSALLDVIVIVAVTPQSLPSPIPGIHQTRTPDTPVYVFIINAAVDVALSPLCPSSVAGQVVVVFVPIVVVVIILQPRGGGHHHPPSPLCHRSPPPLLVLSAVPAIAEVGVISGQAPRR